MHKMKKFTSRLMEENLTLEQLSQMAPPPEADQPICPRI